MDEIANVQQRRLYEALKDAAGEETARAIALFTPLSKSPTDARKADWAQGVCREMERRLPPETVRKARMACHCQPPLKRFERMRRAYEKSRDLEEYVRLQNEANESARFWLEDGRVYMSYPRCYCSFVKNAGRTMPESWCLCSLGYCKALHDFVFACDTRVELLSSVITGGEMCVMRVSLAEK